MIITTTGLAVDQRGISEKALGALIMFVPLFAAGLAPNLFVCVQVIINGKLILLILIGLLNYSLDHFNSLC